MVVGALDARHAAYRTFLDEGRPDGPGPAPVLHVFDRLAAWMAERAPSGCLDGQALAAHPDSEAVSAAVRRHKADTRALLGERCAAGGWTDPALPGALFVLHEGQIAASVLTDPQAARDTTRTLLYLLLKDTP